MLQLCDKFESRKINVLLSRALPYYVKAWHEIDSEHGLFGSLDPAAFNMRPVGLSSPVIEYVVRPHLHILCILAGYLCDLECEPLLQPALTVEAATAMFEKGIRFACATHLTGSMDIEAFLDRRRWGENWRSGLWASLLGLASHLAPTALTDDTREAVRRVVAFEADRFIGVSPPSGCQIDTKLEENAQDSLVLAWALTSCPGHEHAAQWEQALRLWSVNIASSIDDKADHTDYFGRALSSWVTTQTLFPDMTAENNGFFQPEVLSYGMWIVLAIAAYSLAKREIPEFLLRKSHQETFDVLLRFYLPNGMIFSPGGQDIPLFIPRPFALAWGLWNNDPRALLLTEKLLSWIDTALAPAAADTVPWVPGFNPTYEGWELFFQSQVGFELAMLATLPFPKQFRFYSSGQIESAVDTRKNYSFVELCYRRTTRTTRSVAWKAINHHPIIGINIHSYPELIMPFKAALLGIPSVGDRMKHWYVAFHNDRYIKEGFDTYGRIIYCDGHKRPLLRRDVRVITWGDEGLVVLDEIVAEQDLVIDEQYLSPIYLVNDHWTKNQVRFNSGSLREVFKAEHRRYREISCPSFWASIEDCMLFQFVWGMRKGLVYVPGGERNAPPYWKNCRLDMLAVHVESKKVSQGESAYSVGYYIGAGKGPRSFKAAGTPGEFFKGLVIMDGKNTLGFD